MQASISLRQSARLQSCAFRLTPAVQLAQRACHTPVHSQLQALERSPRGCRQHRLTSAAPVASMSEVGAEPADTSKQQDTIVQYVVLRRDLYDSLKWPLGSVVAQACHAATAALWESREEAATQQYCSEQQINHMHKVPGTSVLARLHVTQCDGAMPQTPGESPLLHFQHLCLRQAL